MPAADRPAAQRATGRTARTARTASLVAGAALLLGAPARAQHAAPLHPVCDPIVATLPTDGLPPSHPAVVVAELGVRIEAAGFLPVVDSLARAWATFDPDADVDPALAARFAAELERTRGEFAAIAASDEREAAEAASAGVDIGRFRTSRNAGTFRWRLFAGTPEGTAEIPVPAEAAVCARAVVLHAVLDRYAQPGLQRVAEELRRKVRRWEAYARHTPTQYPWELLLNGFAGSRAPLEPPRRQWVLLHPTAAGELAGRRLDSLVRREVIAMEWIGHVWTNRDGTRSFGLSALSTLASDAPASAGVMVRVGRSLALGAVGRRVGGEWELGSSMSLDLYRLLVGTPDGVRDAIGAAERSATVASTAAAAIRR